jgi:16S rRNA (guanine527-N7)-methyltransferase
MDGISEIIAQGAMELGIELDKRMLDKFSVFTEELTEWNKVMNLTAIKKPEEIAVKHYIDSLAVLKYVKIGKGAKIADVGCGAGFPGIPLKIARDDISLCSIDSLGKRVKFLSQLTEKLGLENCECVHARAEEVGMKAPFREAYDYSFARAVAQLRVLCEYCLPLVRVGGAFVAMKGGDCADEVDEAKNAIKLMGGETENVFFYTLPQTDMARTIIVIRKVKETQAKYPRIYAKIAKSPL